MQVASNSGTVVSVPVRVWGAVQTKEDIANIVQQAQNPPTGPAGWEQDEYIDDAMDEVDEW